MTKAKAAFSFENKFPHELAADDPDLMRLWGEINNAWDEIERLLYRAFDAMLIDVHPDLTHAIFYSQHAHRARREMVLELTECALIGNQELRKRFKVLIGRRVKDRARDRNKLTHGMWGVTTELKDGSSGLCRIALQPNYLSKVDTYPRQRLERVRDDMRNTAKDLKGAIEPLDEEKRAQLPEIISRHFTRVTGHQIDLPQGVAASTKA
jgi:hypothetical protein